MHRLHSVLVSTYLLGGLALMATTSWPSLAGMLTAPGATISMDAAASSDMLAAAAVQEAMQANAALQLMLGILLFTLGGFVHAYAVLRSERPVHITIKPRRSRILYWLEMKI